MTVAIIISLTSPYFNKRDNEKEKEEEAVVKQQILTHFLVSKAEETKRYKILETSHNYG